ncbi:hypothetical protein C5167_000152 [Papaver somniferum]|uniref:Uncharacterized protein n=1 Tax=Papaver somniferum TaxID=3469 RepID=A0A4Y7KUC6_PAPSO|nr:hypothetical protein C5167_000152 [Papaver somniferum]
MEDLEVQLVFDSAIIITKFIDEKFHPSKELTSRFGVGGTQGHLGTRIDDQPNHGRLRFLFLIDGGHY